MTTTDTAHDDGVRRAVLAEIARADAAGQPVDDAAIVRGTGLAPAQVEPALQQMVDDGLIVRTSPGVGMDETAVETEAASGWVLLEAGREALNLR